MTEKKKTRLRIGAAFISGCIVTIVILLAVGAVSGYVRVSKNEYNGLKQFYDKYAKLDTIYSEIEKYYYNDIDEDDMLTGVCRGLVAGLGDPYSVYMTEEEYESWKISATGDYSGIGITFSSDNNGFIILRVMEDSPAEEAGLKVGDYVIAVDGKDYSDMEMMARAIRGKAGSRVEITYYRDGSEKTVNIERRKITEKSVSSKMIDEKTGYISITSFIESTADDFYKALSDVEKRGADKLILDLRDNGGGLVDACTKVADEFLDEGIITYVEDKNKNRKTYDAEDGKTELDTVVLINENSASAAEILAAAMKDNGYETVGEKTYGKGVIQITTELPDGDALKLTVMQYFSPKGNAVNKKGVQPAYVIKDDENTKKDEQLEKALSLMQ